MKLISIAVATALALPLSLFLPEVASSQESEPCQAYTVNTGDRAYGYEEVNTCPLVRGEFSISGTFSNEDWQVHVSAWEPAAYRYKGTNRRDGSSIELIDFDVIGTTSRPQYRFTNGNITYVVTFQYSDPDTIRLEVYQNDRVILNQMLTR